MWVSSEEKTNYANRKEEKKIKNERKSPHSMSLDEGMQELRGRIKRQ